MLNEPTYTSTTKASTTSSRNTSPSTKSRSQGRSRSASKLCATSSRSKRRVHDHLKTSVVYIYDAACIKSLCFPLPHLYPRAAIYKAADATVNPNIDTIRHIYKIFPQGFLAVYVIEICVSLHIALCLPFFVILPQPCLRIRTMPD